MQIKEIKIDAGEACTFFLHWKYLLEDKGAAGKIKSLKFWKGALENFVISVYVLKSFAMAKINV